MRGIARDARMNTHATTVNANCHTRSPSRVTPPLSRRIIALPVSIMLDKMLPWAAACLHLTSPPCFNLLISSQYRHTVNLAMYGSEPCVQQPEWPGLSFHPLPLAPLLVPIGGAPQGAVVPGLGAAAAGVALVRRLVLVLLAAHPPGSMCARRVSRLSAWAKLGKLGALL